MEQNRYKVEIPGYLRISKIIAYLIYFWVILGIVSLVLRVLLLLFAANPSTPFVEFIYRVSSDYLEPFRGIFPSKSLENGSYLDVASIFAIVVYLFLMWGASALVSYLQYKIDTSRYQQEKEIERMRQEKLAAIKAGRKLPQQSTKAVSKSR